MERKRKFPAHGVLETNRRLISFLHVCFNLGACLGQDAPLFENPFGFQSLEFSLCDFLHVAFMFLLMELDGSIPF